MLYDDVCVRPKTLIHYDYGLGCKAYITCCPQSRWTIMSRTDKYVRLANGNVSIELALEDFEKNWIEVKTRR